MERVQPPRRGRVILLNGASSSGKSSIGRAMLPLLKEPWFLVPIDAVGAMRSTAPAGVLDADAVTEMLRRTRLGYHRLVAGLASAGNDVIMDYPLSEPWRLEDLLDVLEGYDVTLVEIRCAPDELSRRELSRGDRPVGLASSQTDVHGHDDHDLAVDTTHSSPELCARSIVERWERGLRPPKAFDRLRGRAQPPT